MAVELPKCGQTVELTIETIASNGKGKGTAITPGWDKLSFFVEQTAPGDRVLARVITARKRYVEADLVEVLSPSPLRVEPVCPHFGACGGCHLMHLQYEKQLAAKRDLVEYIVGRRGFSRESVAEPVASPLQLRYRLRAKLSLTGNGLPGMQARRSHEVVRVDSCHLMRAELEAGLFGACRLLSQSDSGPYDQVQGVLDPASGSVYVQAQRERSAGDWYLVADDRLEPANDAICRLEAGGFSLEYTPFCFTQVNREINESLIAYVLEQMQPKATDRVLELYAGIGNFTLPLAAKVAQVAAVEWQAASQFAQWNAAKAKFENIDHLGMDVGRALKKLDANKARFTKALLDPPREGMGRENSERLAALQPERIVYVACDPLTMIEDVEVLTACGYRMVGVKPFDMFPQTFHIESCAVLEKA